MVIAGAGLSVTTNVAVILSARADRITTALSHARSTVRVVGTCSGSLIVHADGTIAACTNDEDGDACAGIELRHQGDPHRCVDWWGDCLYCGIVRL